MKRALFLLLLWPLAMIGQGGSPQKLAQWKSRAQDVRILRDTWGIPHIFGKTDADAVFGLLFAQCEDDFPRIEMNYIEKLGRLSELNGTASLYEDLLNRIVLDSAAALADYRKAPEWLKQLLDAYADGINYYLYLNRGKVHPKLLQQFKAWYPLLWTDGSIGAINTAGLGPEDLRAFYEGQPTAKTFQPPGFLQEAVTASNGFAIAPSRTQDGHALLYINPHVSFYFRPEVQVVSEEGLQVYGAVTWGQFFVYQGFNSHLGWMHTSSAVDVADLYREKIFLKNGQRYYRFDGQERPLRVKKITVSYRKDGQIQKRTFRTWWTVHGPVMGRDSAGWLALRAENRSLRALEQSWLRTKAINLAQFKSVMDMRTNTSNNTVYADDQGNIAYWHGNFIPRRDPALDWSRPVDGSTARTSWQGLHRVEETVHLVNPASGWIQNCNSTPFTAAGTSSPRAADFPRYMAPDGENFRGLNAVRVLSADSALTLEKLTRSGYDTYLSAFALLVPALVRAQVPPTLFGNGDSAQLLEAFDTLAHWDYYSRPHSVATTLAIQWAERLLSRKELGGWADPVEGLKNFLGSASPESLWSPFVEAVQDLNRNFGNWRIPWGELNRYQRLAPGAETAFSDQAPSLPVGMASSVWGCLPSFASARAANTKKRYGLFGNSFVCAVEFGPRLHARSILTGGESGHSDSPHYSDQAENYSKGVFKEVWFYPEDLARHLERQYHPGE